MELKAFFVTDEDIFAGRDANEAIEAAIAETGCSRDEFYLPEECRQVGGNAVLHDEDGEQPDMLVTDAIKEMTGPGPVGMRG